MGCSNSHLNHVPLGNSKKTAKIDLSPASPRRRVSSTTNNLPSLNVSTDGPGATRAMNECSANSVLDQLDGILRGQTDESVNREGELQPQPKKLDPRLPLNERQLLSIKRSWKVIGRNMVNAAVSMFIKLFETNIDLKDQFEKFKELKDVKDLRLAQSFKEHAILVMYTLDDAINNLDDVPYVIDMLQKTGNTHKRFLGFVPENFYAIEEPFLQAVQEQLGDRFSFGFQVAYKRIIYFFLDTLVRGFKS